MSRGKYLSLEEARKKKQLEQFAKEHPSSGSMEKLFEGIKNAASNKPVKKPSRGNRTSK